MAALAGGVAGGLADRRGETRRTPGTRRAEALAAERGGGFGHVSRMALVGLILMLLVLLVVLLLLLNFLLLLLLLILLVLVLLVLLLLLLLLVLLMPSEYYFRDWRVVINHLRRWKSY